MNKTLAGRYEEFKELLEQKPESILDLTRYMIRSDGLFRLLTIVMEDNAKMREALEGAVNHIDKYPHYRREVYWTKDALKVYEKAKQALDETDPNRKIEFSSTASAARWCAESMLDGEPLTNPTSKAE